MIDLKSMSLSGMEEYLGQLGEPRFRAGQVFEWIQSRRAVSFDGMTNLPKSLREKLGSECYIENLSILTVQESKIDRTRKYLFGLRDGNCVESVFMRYHFGNSVCISSQVGCRMGCGFCASTLHGLVRSLTASEMLEQIYAIARETGERISHVVVMGMGEPFDNYDNLIRFLGLLTCPEGMNLSQRSVTVSTCGIVPGIRRFTGEGLHVTLALSLHAATDEQRRKIMPVANRWSIAELMEACGEYSRVTGRQVTFEYSLIKGVNDSRADALGLVKLAKPLRAHINLIPVNPVRERGFSHPDSEGVRAFKMELEKHGVNVSIRRALGKDIDGACGQLRNRYAEQEPGTV